MMSTDKVLVALLTGLHWGVEGTSISTEGPEASGGQRKTWEPRWVWHHRDDNEVA